MQAADDPSRDISTATRIAITVVTMSASLMQVLDTTIANVALPHMQASLGATQDSIAWVLTSYIIASAIATPVTGWIEARIGRRNLFLLSVIGFTVSSMACGLAPTLPAMVAARVFQGISGAFLGPLCQAILLDTYPPEKQPVAMTIWGMGVMIGPILGPFTGGVLTEYFDWRWVFFINVPVGIGAAIGGWLLIRPARSVDRPFDLIGFALLSLMLAAFQLMLDRGTEVGWFDATEIWIEAAMALGTFWMFVVHSATTEHPLIPMGVLRDRNLMIGSVFLAVCSGAIIAGSALIAPMLQRLLGFGVINAGALMIPRGLATMASMIIAGRLQKWVDSRILIAVGMSLGAYSQWMMTGFDLQMGTWPILISGVVQGFGFGLVLMPLNLLAFATLPAHLRTEGAAFYSLARNLGAAVAISITTALLARNLQISHADLSVHVTALTLPFLDPSVVGGLASAGTIATMVDAEVNRQALMIAYLDDFLVMTIAAACLAPVSFLLHGVKGPIKAAPITE